jgi:aspartyl/asparaginyl beta-hydroxylase (cupin superfamily)
MQLLQPTKSKSLKPWYVASGQPYDGNDPCFFDPRDFPWVQRIEAEWETIRDELDRLLQEQGDSLVPYFNPTLVSKAGGWKTFTLFFWNLKFWSNCRKCPKTTKLLQSIPHMIGASFTMLEPGVAVTPHHGDTNAIARAHLGLSIPGRLPECGLEVGGEQRSWSNGKVELFCDAHVHTAWNHTPHRRFILIIDVMRPEYAHLTNRVCLRIWYAMFVQWWETRKQRRKAKS